MKIEYSKLNWPPGLNLDLLLEILTEDQLRNFLAQHSKKKRLERRIMLPSAQCVRKVLFFYLWSLIEEGKTNWAEIKADFKSEFRTLKALGITKYEAHRIYKQRKREISRGM